MKRVRMNRSVAMARQSVAKGDEIDIADSLAESWCDGGVAEDITPSNYKPDTESDDDLDDLKVDELRDRLEAAGQSTEGKKAELVARLREVENTESGDGSA